MHFKCLPHPPYSPDLAHSDYHIIGPFKEATGGKIFCSAEVQEAVHEWLYTQPKNFFKRNLGMIVENWKTGNECNQNYAENLQSCNKPICNIQDMKNFLRFSFYLSSYWHYGKDKN
jgi:hypothetical protein